MLPFDFGDQIHYLVGQEIFCMNETGMTERASFAFLQFSAQINKIWKWNSNHPKVSLIMCNECTALSIFCDRSGNLVDLMEISAITSCVVPSRHMNSFNKNRCQKVNKINKNKLIKVYKVNNTFRFYCSCTSNYTFILSRILIKTFNIFRDICRFSLFFDWPQSRVIWRSYRVILLTGTKRNQCSSSVFSLISINFFKQVVLT